MELIKSFFSSKTPRGRAVRTALQVGTALWTFLVATTASPEFAKFMADIGAAGQVGSVMGLAAAISRAWSLADKASVWLRAWAEGDL